MPPSNLHLVVGRAPIKENSLPTAWIGAFNCQAAEMAGREVIAPGGLSLADLRDAIEPVTEVDIVERRERRRSRTWLTVRRRTGCCLPVMMEAKSCDHKSSRRQRVGLTWRASGRFGGTGIRLLL
jgi:hypothetical protein